MKAFQDTLSLYDYSFPGELIAQSPASPRDSATLLVYDRKKDRTDWSTFRSIGDFLPKNSVLVLNETKVIPARIQAAKETGGKVSLLVLGTKDEAMLALANKKIKEGERLTLGPGLQVTVEERRENAWILRPSFPLSRLQGILEAQGTMPLPPYIKHCPLSEDEIRQEYQSVFAHEPGSIAAPTASLHFTPELLESLKNAGITLAYVTLHVHLGTFAPLTEEQWKTGQLHRESYHIEAKTQQILRDAKKAGRPIIAVGTTVVRTLESAADESGNIIRPSGDTNLFIREGYCFKVIDGLITNFHVPKSSLLMLVSALVGREKLLELYAQAIERKCRLFSFGDGMLVV